MIAVLAIDEVGSESLEAETTERAKEKPSQVAMQTRKNPEQSPSWIGLRPNHAIAAGDRNNRTSWRSPILFEIRERGFGFIWRVAKSVWGGVVVVE